MSDTVNVRLSTGQLLHPGEYGKDIDGKWYALTPNGLLAGLSRHTVTAHDDGTISVSPSILCTRGDEQYHGFLEHGAWRLA